MSETLTVEIPLGVRDNSETVTDYAFMGHLSPGRGVVGPVGRDRENRVKRDYLSHKYTYYSWTDANPGGQRCRFDMWVANETGQVVNLFHTEYFTRVACAECEHHYAVIYQVIETEGCTSGPAPRCGYHSGMFRELWEREGVRVHESEHLIIGQHD